MALIGFIFKAILFLIVGTILVFIILGIYTVCVQVLDEIGKKWSTSIMNKIEAWFFGKK